MAIVRFTCPECDEVFKASGEPAPGKKVKCPACKHAFVPSTDDDEEDSVGEEKPRPKAKSSAKKNAAPPAKKRRRADEDEDEGDDADEDEDSDEDDAPAKRKKKKKKPAGVNVLYWVYRGASVFVLLVLLGVLAWVLVIRFSSGRAPLDESVLQVDPDQTRSKIIASIAAAQNVNVSAKAISGQFSIFVFLEKDAVEAEKAIALRKDSAKFLASFPKRTEAEFPVLVPANESAVVLLTSGDGKKTEVKLKLSN